MIKSSKQAQYIKQGLTTLTTYNAEAFSRNTGLLSLAEQEKLATIRVAIAGMGGVGGVHLITLLRTGVCQFNISDLDEFEIANMNRQYGAKISNVGQKKVHVMAKEALEINPYADINIFDQGVSEDNIDEFLNKVDIVVDGMDAFNIKIRRLIFDKAWQKGIPVVTSGPLGYSSALITFIPGKGLSFDKYFDMRETDSEETQFLKFFMGLSPRSVHFSYVDMKYVSFKKRIGPSLGLACQLCAATATTEVIRIILGKQGVKAAPYYFQYDLLCRTFIKNYMPFGNRNPIQRLRIYQAQKYLAKSEQRIGAELISPPVLKSIRDEVGNLDPALVHYLMKAGQQAPSGENLQPWNLVQKDNTIQVYLAPEVDRSIFNGNQIASVIACGAVVENISLAASHYCLDTVLDWSESQSEGDMLVSLSFNEHKLPEDPMARFIWERQTNRTKWKSTPIPQNELEMLTQACKSIPDASVSLFTEQSDLELIAGIVSQADMLRGEVQSIHESLMENIKFKKRDVFEQRIGFSIKNLEIGLGGELFIRLMRDWKMANRLNKVGASKLVSKLAGAGIKQASAVGLIRIKGRDRKSVFEGGRAMERVWLTATRLGISFQPMTVATFLWMLRHLKKQDGLSLKHRELLESVWPIYDKIFNSQDDESHIMLFRIGYGKKVKVGTLRKEIPH